MIHLPSVVKRVDNKINRRKLVLRADSRRIYHKIFYDCTPSNISDCNLFQKTTIKGNKFTIPVV